MSGIVIRDLAMAEAVPVGTVLAADEFWATEPDEVPRLLVDCTIVEWRGMPVANAQSMRSEMLAEAKWLRMPLVGRDGGLPTVADRIEAWVEHLFPAAIFDAPEVES